MTVDVIDLSLAGDGFDVCIFGNGGSGRDHDGLGPGGGWSCVIFSTGHISIIGDHSGCASCDVCSLLLPSHCVIMWHVRVYGTGGLKPGCRQPFFTTK